MSEVFDWNIEDDLTFESRLATYLSVMTKKELKARIFRNKEKNRRLRQTRFTLFGHIAIGYNVDDVSDSIEAGFVNQGLMLGLDVAVVGMGNSERIAFLERVVAEYSSPSGLLASGVTDLVIDNYSRDVSLPVNASEVLPDMAEFPRRRFLSALGCMAVTHDNFVTDYEPPGLVTSVRDFFEDKINNLRRDPRDKAKTLGRTRTGSKKPSSTARPRPGRPQTSSTTNSLTPDPVSFDFRKAPSISTLIRNTQSGILDLGELDGEAGL